MPLGGSLVVNASIVALITGLMLASVMFPDRSGAQEGQFYAGKTLTPA
jgi:hypothetical protein